MTTPATMALDVPTILALTLACTSVLKALLEVWITPDQRLHDPAVQLLALVVGIAWSFAFSAAYASLNAASGLQAVSTVILGLVGATGAIGTYHVSTALKGVAVSAPASQTLPEASGGTGPSVSASGPPPPDRGP